MLLPAQDDGSHLPTHQRVSFEALWPAVVPGGLYAIEDIETSYWDLSQTSRASLYGYPMANEVRDPPCAPHMSVAPTSHHSPLTMRRGWK